MTTEMALQAAQPFEIGIYSFAELTPDPRTRQMLSPAERIQNLLEEITLADQVGLDIFGLGEHHRPDFVSSAPEVILAAAAKLVKAGTLTWPHRHGMPPIDRFKRLDISATIRDFGYQPQADAFEIF